MQHLAGEFVAEIFSNDSNLVRTLRCLFLRPGCLTKEYRAGRRASYIAPFRLYLLVAARVVYEQSTGRTLLKFALLAPFYFVLLALAAALVAVLTLVK